MKIPKKKCVKRTGKKSDFDKRSFRWINNRGTKILIGCPKGEWMPRAKRCAVGTKSFEVVRARKGSSCKAGYKKVG